LFYYKQAGAAIPKDILEEITILRITPVTGLKKFSPSPVPLEQEQVPKPKTSVKELSKKGFARLEDLEEIEEADEGNEDEEEEAEEEAVETGIESSSSRITSARYAVNTFVSDCPQRKRSKSRKLRHVMTVYMTKYQMQLLE
jgi:hypothetical protein